MSSPEAALVMETLNTSGEVRFVGGAVRDAILEKNITDIDMATTHLPDDCTKLLEKQGVKVIPTGIKHGTVTAVINHRKFEITTLRKDVECYGRHAQVEFTDNWKEDAARRDFTINAMSMDDDGNIYDYFGGMDDLREGIIRFVGESKKRIEEDYLRILRLFRFHAYYGKKDIDERQIKSVEELSLNLKSISGERVQSEMFKILSAPDPVYVLEIMNDTGVFEPVLEGISNPINLSMVRDMVSINHGTGNAILILAVILYDNGAEEQQLMNISDKWRLSNDDKKRLMTISFPKYNISSEISVKEQKKAMRKLGEYFSDSVLWQWAVELKNSPDKKAAINSYFKHILSLYESWQSPQFPLRGEDIIKIGKKEGEEIGNLLKKAEEYWESEDYKPTKQNLLNYIKTI